MPIIKDHFKKNHCERLFSREHLERLQRSSENVGFIQNSIYVEEDGNVLPTQRFDFNSSVDTIHAPIKVKLN